MIVFLTFFGPKTQKPASEEMLSKLTTNDYDPDVHVGEKSCSICSDEFTTGDKVIVLPCDTRHIYHETCIKNWLKVNAICPLCRVPLPGAEPES